MARSACRWQSATRSSPPPPAVITSRTAMSWTWKPTWGRPSRGFLLRPANRPHPLLVWRGRNGAKRACNGRRAWEAKRMRAWRSRANRHLRCSSTGPRRGPPPPLHPALPPTAIATPPDASPAGGAPSAQPPGRPPDGSPGLLCPPTRHNRPRGLAWAHPPGPPPGRLSLVAGARSAPWRPLATSPPTGHDPRGGASGRPRPRGTCTAAINNTCREVVALR